MNIEVMKFDFKQQIEKPDTLELYIYSEVAPDGYDWWTGKTIESETSADFFRQKLSEYKDVKYINLYINSAGGSVREGYGIYAQLKRHASYKTVYVDGFANSIASVIAMAGDKIIMRINSMMGIHNAMDHCFGNAAEHRKTATDLDKLMEGNRQVYLSRSAGKITELQLIELLDKTTLLTAQECLAYGFCDEISEQEADVSETAQMMQRVNLTIAAQAKYFQSLKQSFGEAMGAIQYKKLEEPVPAAPAAEPPKDPEPAPQENKPIKFLQALMR